MAVSDDQLRHLDALQRKASLLIQGFGFFLSIQQEVDFRNKLKDEYIKLMEEVLNGESKE